MQKQTAVEVREMRIDNRREWRLSIKSLHVRRLRCSCPFPQADVAKKRLEAELQEARWAGVPAWKRAIIEKKEAGEGAFG